MGVGGSTMVVARLLRAAPAGRTHQPLHLGLLHRTPLPGRQPLPGPQRQHGRRPPAPHLHLHLHLLTFPPLRHLPPLANLLPPIPLLPRLRPLIIAQVWLAELPFPLGLLLWLRRTAAIPRIF